MSQFGFAPLPSANATPTQEPSGPSLKKDFPRVYSAIQLMWGHKELNLYFRNLMVDARGSRDGFPPAVWAEINELMHQHSEQFPD
jgi:hypothetical protein